KATTVSMGKRSCDGPTFGTKNTAAYSKKMSQDIPVSVDEEIPSSPSPLENFEKPVSEFCNFGKPSLDKFKTVQIWALYWKLDEFPKNYAKIESVESYPVSKYIKSLRRSDYIMLVGSLATSCAPRGVIPWADKKIPVCCGTFKVASGEAAVFIDSISFYHQLSGVASDNNLYTIYPRVGEVWAMFGKFCTELSCSELRNGEYCMVEVVEVVNARWIIISVLQSVTSFKTVFSSKEKEGIDSAALAIPWIELYRFSHQVPAFRLTEAIHGKLRGCWDLDPKSVPVCLYSTK
ncbi:hypothetical protein MKX03_008405, partial [Papaver bracteatum]